MGRAQTQDKYMLRLPDGMREQIKADALMNERSMNAEIIARLSGTQANLRDQIAIAAMSGWMASFTANEAVKPEGVASLAYAVADAMLAERAKGGAS